jgi:CheY-like chemotaxis protein
MHKLKPRVLLVDDDRVYRFAAVKTIASTELASEIIECNDGQEALNFIKQHIAHPHILPDIMFLDINMPVMNGWDFLKAFTFLIPEISKTIPIYIVTSSIDKSDIEHSKEFNAVTDYVVKPVFKETFSRILRAIHV